MASKKQHSEATHTSTGGTGSGSQTKFAISDAAFSKALLHAAKFPHAPCLGLLLGRIDEGVIVLTDAIPMCHSTPTAVVLEACTMLVEEHCASPEISARIVGVYFAPDSEAPGPTDLVKRVASQLAIRMLGKPFCLLVVANERLSGGEAAVPFDLFVPQGAAWTLRTERLVVEGAGAAAPTPANAEAVNANFTRRLREGKASAVVDFEDSLEDVSLDWRNPRLLEQRPASPR